MGKSYSGMNKASLMTDRLLDDMDRAKKAYQSSANAAPADGWKPAWTSERWAHRVNATPTPKDK